MIKNVCLILILTAIFQNGNSARILAIVQTASYSHQMFFQQIWRELAIRGHDMVVITTDPTGEKLPNFKEVSIKESYGPMTEMMEAFIEEGIVGFFLNKKLKEKSFEIARHQINLPQVQEIIRNKSEHFDLLMIEHMHGPYYALKEIYKCPVIGVMSLDGFPQSHGAMGNPVHNILYPTAMLPFQENLSFLQRLGAVGLTILFKKLIMESSGKMNELVKEHFGDGIGDIDELYLNLDMLFVNANPLFTPVRPHTPSTISLAGGVHMKPPKPLPKELKDFLDSAKEGVIYFSLGSNVKSNKLSLELRKTIMDTLSQLPYKVLWKFEDDTLPGKPENVKITKWAPQQDVLRHKNVKVFITQGGIQSLEEALYTHVPVVVMPFMADQAANAEKVNSKGLGLVVNRYNLNVKDFKTAIEEVMTNPKYRDNVRKLAMQIQDEPMTPLERAVWWTEYVLRHNGSQHLKGPRIPLYQYYYLDILGFLAVAIIVLISILVLLVKGVVKGVKRFFCKKENSKKNQKKVKRT